MYKFTRQEVAKELNISTRSVDRYIKAGKLRSKKEGKVVYVKSSDVENLKSGGKQKHEVIIEKESNSDNIYEKKVLKNTESSFGGLNEIYKDLREEIKNKDELIQTLAMRVGKAEEVAKNSVSLMDFKKSQFLLEESKGGLNKEVLDLEKQKSSLEKDLKYEKNTNIILIIFVVILLIIAGTIWFIKI